MSNTQTLDETKMTESLSLNDIADQLLSPFPPVLVELIPASTNKEKTKGLACCYADPRHYEERLDALVGVEGWQVSYDPWDKNKIICQLTILGITKSDVGEAGDGDRNAATVAVAQAFKRACSKFGLGRYFYSLPQVWAEINEYKQFVNPEKVVQEIYRRAGLLKEVATAPTQPIRSARDTSEQKVSSTDEQRKKRGGHIASLGLVEHAGDHYKIKSPSVKDKQMTFTVRRNQRNQVVCSCEEFQEGVIASDSFKCEHIYAVKTYVLTQPDTSDNSSSEEVKGQTSSPSQPSQSEILNRNALLASIEDAHYKLEANKVEPSWTIEDLTLYVNEKYEVEHGINDTALSIDQLKEIKEDLWARVDSFYKSQKSEPSKPAQAPADTSVEFPRDPLAKSVADLVTPKQLGMVRALGHELSIDVEVECQSVLRCKTDELSKRAASSFISHLKAIQAEAKQAQ